MSGQNVGDRSGQRLQRDAENLALPSPKPCLTRLRGLIRPALDQTGFKGGTETTGSFYLLEVLPTGLGKGFGAALDEG